MKKWAKRIGKVFLFSVAVSAVGYFLASKSAAEAEISQQI